MSKVKGNTKTVVEMDDTSSRNNSGDVALNVSEVDDQEKDTMDSSDTVEQGVDNELGEAKRVDNSNSNAQVMDKATSDDVNTTKNSGEKVQEVNNEKNGNDSNELTVDNETNRKKNTMESSDANESLADADAATVNPTANNNESDANAEKNRNETETACAAVDANKDEGAVNNTAAHVVKIEATRNQSEQQNHQIPTPAVKSEQPDENNRDGVLAVKIENCVHFDPKQIEGVGDGGTDNEPTQEQNKNASETFEVKIETITVKQETASKRRNSDGPGKKSLSKTQENPDDLIELSSSDSEDNYEETRVLNAADIDFGNSSSSPVEINDDDSDADLCIDLLDSDDDVEDDGVWKYGKDILLKKTKPAVQNKRQLSMGTCSSAPKKKVLKTESTKSIPGLKIVKTCTSNEWMDEDVPLHRRIAMTTKPMSNAMGLKLPSLESRINDGVQKVSLQELPRVKREKLLKRERKKDAQLKLEYHKSLENGLKTRNETSHALLRNIAKEKETIIQCLSDDSEEEPADTTEILQIPCKKCDIVFRCTKSFKKHTCVSGSKQPGLFTCTECNERFDSKGHLMNHLPIHDPQVKYRRKFTCRFCHIVFSSRSMQSKHERDYHPDLLRFACQHCDETFSTRIQRSTHEKEARHGAWHAIPNQDMIDLTANITHGEFQQFPHKCEICKRAFSRGSSLMQHMSSLSHREKVKLREQEEKLARQREEQKENPSATNIKPEKA